MRLPKVCIVDISEPEGHTPNKIHLASEVKVHTPNSIDQDSQLKVHTPNSIDRHSQDVKDQTTDKKRQIEERENQSKRGRPKTSPKPEIHTPNSIGQAPKPEVHTPNSIGQAPKDGIDQSTNQKRGIEGASSQERPKTSLKHKKNSKTFKVGEKIEAAWRNRKKWYCGTVKAVTGGLYSIAYDDGDTETKKKAKFIRSRQVFRYDDIQRTGCSCRQTGAEERLFLQADGCRGEAVLVCRRAQRRGCSCSQIQQQLLNAQSEKDEADAQLQAAKKAKRDADNELLRVRQKCVSDMLAVKQANEIAQNDLEAARRQLNAEMNAAKKEVKELADEEMEKAHKAKPEVDWYCDTIKAQIFCPRGHGLLVRPIATSYHFRGSYRCNVCHEIGKNRENLWCGVCNFDACGPCTLSIASKKRVRFQCPSNANLKQETNVIDLTNESEDDS